MDTLKTCWFYKTRSVQISAYSNTWTESVNWTRVFEKKKCFQGSHFVYVGEGRVMMMVGCVSGSVGVLMRFLWRSLGVGMGMLKWGWVCVWGCGRVGEGVLDKWHSLCYYSL